MAAPEQSGAPPENLPQAALVTPQPRSGGARMTQVLVSLNTLGLEMNRQVMTVRELHLTSSAATQVIWKYGDAKSRQAWILSPD